MAAIYWPSILPKAQVMFHPAVPSRSGGVSVTGLEQVVASSAGFWRAEISFAVLRRTGVALPGAMHIAWRAMLANLEGRTNPLCIGPCDHANAPAAVAGYPTGPFYITHSDGSQFSDGAYYHQNATSAEVLSTTAAGATEITIWVEPGHEPQAGQYFSLRQRLYLIKRATQTSQTSPFDPSEWTLRFWPTLRELAPIGRAVNFDNPVATMRLASDESGELTIPTGRGLMTNPTLTLVEYLGSP